ncbi:uncharacterized protein V1513DRAFT_69111 [Lipomyces chichibuensis]|uniref:uncharacterized protein n=1 Tax=Lipomyces chichibuensis TaxID=1546026 RepID=UPI0033441AA0
MTALSISLPDQRYDVQLLQKHRSRLSPSILLLIAWTSSLLMLHFVLKIIAWRVIKWTVYVFLTRHPLPTTLDIVLSKAMIADTYEMELPNNGRLILQVAAHIASVWYCDHCLSKAERQIVHSLRYRGDAGPRWRRAWKLAAFILAAALGVFCLGSVLGWATNDFVLWSAVPTIARARPFSFIRDRNMLFFFGKLKFNGILSYLESFVTPSTATSASSLFALMVLFLEFHTHVLTIFVLTPLSSSLAAGISVMQDAIYSLYCWSMPFIMRFRAEHGINACELGWKISIQLGHGRVYSVDIRRRSLSTDNPTTPISPSMNLKPSTSIFRRHKLRLLKENVRGTGLLSSQNSNKEDSRHGSADSKLDQWEKGLSDCLATRHQGMVLSDLIGSYSDIEREIATRHHSTMLAENRHIYRTSSNSGGAQSLIAIFQGHTSATFNDAETTEVSVRSPTDPSSSDSFTQYIQINIVPNKQSSSLPIIRWPRTAESASPFKSRSMSVSKFRYVSNPKFSLPESPIKKKRSISAISVNILSSKVATHSAKVTRAVENCV